MTEQTFKVGDRVGYACVPALMDYKGTVVALGRTERGGDCTIQWDNFPTFTSEECTFNLRTLS